MRNNAAGLAPIVMSIFVCLSQANLAALEFAVNNTGFEMTVIWQQESAEKGFSLQAQSDKINILWGSEDSDKLKIMPAEYGVDFEYRIDISPDNSIQADRGLIKMSLARSRDYDALDYRIGFYYDYTDYLRAGMETSGEVIDGVPRFSLRPIIGLELGTIGYINSGFDIGNVTNGKWEDALYIDIRCQWKW
ncbi:MAG: hypothetical protein LBS97_02150 [Treponema sp.]|jgi:hypothetical protein|nr:hypothetical protein [Treponema sp.]